MARTWREIWYDFSQATTFHGVRYIGDRDAITFRRVCWAVIVVLGLSLFAQQIIANIKYYQSSPVNVNVKINYNNSLPFPALTICNQNSFRTTKASEMGLYDSLFDLYTSGENSELKLNETFLNMSTLDVFNATSHRKQDLIVGCSWMDQECSHEDFETIVTDHGICYKFNGQKAGDIRITSETGAENGLKLLLNVEQYEYMPGPNDGAGLKVLVHDQHEIPLVKSMGQAVTPGAHVFTAVKMLQIKNLKPPHGKCAYSKQLQYYANYSVSACKVDNLGEEISKNCHCRAMYMPELSPGFPPVCDVQTHRTCVRSTIKRLRCESVKVATDDASKCPIPCFQTMFSTVTSQSSISNFNTHRMLLRSDVQSLKTKFFYAREVTQRVDREVVRLDNALIMNLAKATHDVKLLLAQLNAMVKTLSFKVTQTLNDVKPRVDFHSRRGLNGSIYNVQYNVVRAWILIKERTAIHISFGYRQLLDSFERRLQSIQSIYVNETKELIFWQVDSELLVKLDGIDRLLNNLSSLENTFIEMKPKVLGRPYRTSTDRRYDHGLLSEYFLHWNLPYVLYVIGKMKTRTSEIGESLAEMRMFAKGILEQNRNDVKRWQALRKQIIFRFLSYNYWMFNFEERCTEKTLEIAKNKWAGFLLKNKTMYENSRALLRSLTTTQEYVDISNYNFDRLEHLSTEAMYYFRNSKETKTSLAKELTSNDIYDAVNEIKSILSDIRHKADSINADWDSFRDAYNDVWSEMINDAHHVIPDFYTQIQKDLRALMDGDITDQYNRTRSVAANFAMLTEKEFDTALDFGDLIKIMNADLPSINVTNKTVEIHQIFAAFKNDSNIGRLFSGRHEKYYDALKALQVSLNQFLLDNRMDAEFIRQNFVQLDVFMQDLSYEYIEQQKAYDDTALWSDIGGSMGLFIGASIVTVFEVIDTILNHLGSLGRMGKRRQQDEKERDNGTNTEGESLKLDKI